MGVGLFGDAFGGRGFVEAALVGDVFGALLSAGLLRRGIISPRLVVSLPGASPGMSRVMTAAVGRHRRGNNSRLPGWVV